MRRLLFAGLVVTAVMPVVAQDVQQGEKLAQGQCAACHGKDFVNSVDATYPRLAGQYPDYLEKALREYKSGARKNAIMNAIAKPLSAADIRNVSAYLMSLPSPLTNERR